MSLSPHLTRFVRSPWILLFTSADASDIFELFGTDALFELALLRRESIAGARTGFDRVFCVAHSHQVIARDTHICIGVLLVPSSQFARAHSSRIQFFHLFRAFRLCIIIRVVEFDGIISTTFMLRCTVSPHDLCGPLDTVFLHEHEFGNAVCHRFHRVDE